MDRLIISHKFIGDLNKLSRSQARLTASERLAYTGMDICEESSLQYDSALVHCPGILVWRHPILGNVRYYQTGTC